MSKPKKTAKKKIFGIQKKLLITMVPMFVIAFAATIVLIFVSKIGRAHVRTPVTH